jgi:S1-C subfamily serine protease
VSANWVDVALLVGLLVVAIAGWRSGVITTAAAFTGFIGGALCGAWLVPQLLQGREWPTFLQAMATLAGMFVLGVLGQAILGFAGRTVRDAVDFRPIRLVDSASGMVVSVLAFLLCAWMVLSVAASSSLGPTSEQVRASRGFPLLDQVLAGPGGALLDDARELLATIDVPSLPFNPATLPPVEDPSNVDISRAAARVARDSVVQVSTTSTRCGSSSLGSGVVVGPGRVVTNAHVVAGAGRITVGSASDHATRGARLVYLDPDNDVAILHVPGLESPAPRWVAEAPRGTDAVVAGYPGGGPLTLGEARVRGQVLVADDQGSGSREVHVFRGLVRPGNSGGALLRLDGSVLGLVFANAQDDDQTGFALTRAEVRAAIDGTRNATDEVSSGPCRVL